MSATQESLYEGLEYDPGLSWSERELPQRLRTKHVHSLHPYLGKYVPQLVEELLRRFVRPGGRVLDPFAGSGTTLVQALESGHDSVGVDIAAFNCLLMRVKTQQHNPFVLERELRDALARFEAGDGRAGRASPYVRRWLAPRARAELLRFGSLVDDYESADVLRVVLARAARSARLTTHFDLDFPKTPQLEPYWCHKHRRECRPVEHADHFLRRYLLDTLARLKEFGRLRGERAAEVVHGDAREVIAARDVCGRGHLTAVSGADRLPRAASLRLRAARPRRPARARARRGRARDRACVASATTSTGSARCWRRRPLRSRTAAGS